MKWGSQKWSNIAFEIFLGIYDFYINISTFMSVRLCVQGAVYVTPKRFVTFISSGALSDQVPKILKRPVGLSLSRRVKMRVSLEISYFCLLFFKFSANIGLIRGWVFSRICGMLPCPFLCYISSCFALN